MEIKGKKKIKMFGGIICTVLIFPTQILHTCNVHLGKLLTAARAFILALAIDQHGLPARVLADRLYWYCSNVLVRKQETIVGISGDVCWWLQLLILVSY